MLFSVCNFCFNDLVAGFLFTQELVFKIDPMAAFDAHFAANEGNDSHKENNERLVCISFLLIDKGYWY